MLLIFPFSPENPDNFFSDKDQIRPILCGCALGALLRYLLLCTSTWLVFHFSLRGLRYRASLLICWQQHVSILQGVSLNKHRVNINMHKKMLRPYERCHTSVSMLDGFASLSKSTFITCSAPNVVLYFFMMLRTGVSSSRTIPAGHTVNEIYIQGYNRSQHTLVIVSLLLSFIASSSLAKSFCCRAVASTLRRFNSSRTCCNEQANQNTSHVG